MKYTNRRDKEQITLDCVIDTVTVMILVFSGTYGFWALQALPPAAVV